MDLRWENEGKLGRVVGNGFFEWRKCAILGYVLDCAGGLEFDPSDAP